MNVTVQLDPDLLAKVDSRVGELDLNRSQYFRRLAKKDLGLIAETQAVAQKPETAHAQAA